MYGREAIHDVYPHILKALDAHARDQLHFNDSACRHVLKAVKSLEFKSGMNSLRYIIHILELFILFYVYTSIYILYCSHWTPFFINFKQHIVQSIVLFTPPC